MTPHVPARPPTATDAPVILWNEDPRHGRLVVACCRRSHALGVRLAMPIAGASEMVSRGKPTGKHSERSRHSEPRIELHDPWLDLQALEQLAAHLQQQISPLVAVEALDNRPWAGHPRHQPESLWCDITGTVHLFGDESGLLRAVEQLLHAQRLCGRMAIANSVAAAWALAHYAEPGDQKFANDNSQTRSDAERISPLPIESLRISTATASTLRRLGMETVGELLRLPKSGLATRLGQALVRRIDQALGETEEPLAVYRPHVDHTHALELEYPTSDPNILADRIQRLTEKARAGLAACNRGALRFTCCLDLAVHPPLTLNVGLFAPTLDVDHLSGLVVNQLENQMLSSDVTRITLSVTLTGPLRSNQSVLFPQHGGDTAGVGAALQWTGGTAISRLVDSLSGRLGRDAVVGVSLEQDPLPEAAFRVRPLTGNAVSNSKKPRRSASGAPISPRIQCSDSLRYGSARSATASAPSAAEAMRRPLSLLARPIPLTVDSFCHRLPDRFRLDGVTHQVIRYWGPERIETGWWKGPSIRRDYYRIETDRGLWWWIFRNLVSSANAGSPTPKSDCWMLHGRFA